MPLAEKALIRRIRARVIRGAALVKGIGDDSAVLRVPTGHELLVTTDLMVENVHFRRDWQSPETIGQRCLTRGLSDIAAMGGQARACFISLALDRDVPQAWVDKFLSGLLRWAKRFKVPLAGGDTAESPWGIHADIVVVGSVPRGEAVLRSGAKAGDRIYVTGRLGAGASAIASFVARKPGGDARRSTYQPLPRLAVGAWLREKRVASAMIDISDGLSTDLGHICEESRVGAEIEEAAIPRAFVAQGKKVLLEMALHGGEDYELLFTSSKKAPARIAGVEVSHIGKITRGGGMQIRDAEGQLRRLEIRGWEHFRANAQISAGNH
jgi:thiamine-monophosphate kinase